MNEMVDFVAKALEPKCRAFGQGNMPMQVAREFARTAIEAMEIPTRAMVLAGFDQLSREPSPHAAEDCWIAMVREARK